MAPPRDTSLRYPGGRRALWGFVGTAFIYALTLTVTALRRSSLVRDLTFEVEIAGSTQQEAVHPQFVDFDAVADWEIAGIVYYNAHLAPFEVPAQVFDEQTGVETFNLITNAGGVLTLLVVVPVIVYTVTGAVGVRKEPTRTARGRGFAGMLQFTGVLPAALLGLVVFSISTADGTAGPSLLWAPVLAGFVYPAACGFIGGYLAAAVQDESTFDTKTTDSWGD